FFYSLSLHDACPILLELVASFVLYLWFHFEMKKIKQSENWIQENNPGVVIDTTFRDEKLTHSNWWFLVPGMIILGTIIFTNFKSEEHTSELQSRFGSRMPSSA